MSHVIKTFSEGTDYLSSCKAAALNKTTLLIIFTSFNTSSVVLKEQSYVGVGGVHCVRGVMQFTEQYFTIFTTNLEFADLKNFLSNMTKTVIEVQADDFGT